MWRRKLYRLLQIIESVIDKLLKIVWSIIIKGLRITHQPRLRHPLLISVSVMGITAIIALSVTGLFNYTPDTSPSFPYIQPPAGERQKYYFEITPEALWQEFLSPYSDYFMAQNNYVGNSFIFKDILIDEYKLSRKYETYIVINQVQFVARNPSDLQKLKEGDVVDITGVCVGLSDKDTYIIVGNCQFLPAGLVPLPLPGGPAPISPSY